MATGRRRGRAIIYIALILILLLVLLLVVARYLNPGLAIVPGGVAPTSQQQQPVSQATAAPPQDVVNIVVTTQDVRRGQELKDDLLAMVAIPRADYTEGVFFTDKKEVSGVRSRARLDLKAHTPLTSALIVQGSDGSIPSFEIPAGRVAISIPISKLSSVSYGLQKGDHVNVIVSLLMVDLDTNFQSKLPNRTGYVVAPGPVGQNQTNVTAQLFSPPEYTISAPSAASLLGRIELDPSLNNPVFVIPAEPQRPRLVSQTLIQDVIVLQMGAFDLTAQTAGTTAGAEEATPAPAAAQRQQATPEAAPIIPNVVTLIVSPQDAVSINYLMLAGANLNLVMRSAGDSEVKDTEAVTLQFILDQYRIPNPMKLPYGLEPRMDQFPQTVPPFPEPGAAPVAAPTVAR